MSGQQDVSSPQYSWPDQNVFNHLGGSLSTFFQPSESNNTAAHAPRTKDLQDAAEVKETSDALLSRLRAKELERHLDRNIINVVEKQVEEGEKQEDRRQEQETSVVLEEKTGEDKKRAESVENENNVADSFALSPLQNGRDREGDFEAIQKKGLDITSPKSAAILEPSDLVGRWIHVESMGAGRVLHFEKKHNPFFGHSIHYVDFVERGTFGLVLGRMKFCRWNNGLRYSLCSNEEVLAMLNGYMFQQQVERDISALIEEEKLSRELESKGLFV